MLSIFTLGVVALAASSEVSASPKPVPITLQSRKTPRGHNSGLRKRALSAISVPLDDFFLGTDLQWFGNISGTYMLRSCPSQYAITSIFSVGTPPQDVSVVFDTGSTSLEFVSTDCTSCVQTPKFDPARSSTFVRGSRTTTLDFATGVGVDPVVNNDYVLTIRSATDTVTVGGIAARNVSLFTIIDQTPAFNVDPFLGIQGMGSRAQGFFAALVQAGLPCE